MKNSTIKQKLKGIPAGIVGIPTSFLGRYREFDSSLNEVLLPPNSQKLFAMGCDIGFNFNELVTKMMENPEMRWLWILGDDHDFPKNLFYKLYERNVDIIVPLCLRKSDHAPVLNCGVEGGFVPHPDRWEVLRGKSGIMEWTGTVGNAGMLIRRNVFEAMDPPWFRQGQLDLRYSSSDLFFCWYAQQSGFKVYIDLDNVIGHIEHVSQRPRRDKDGNWFADICYAGHWDED